MHKIDTLLVRHGITPTRISEQDKKRLAVWLEQATSDTPNSFFAFAKQARGDRLDMQKKISQYTDSFERLLKHANQTVEALLGAPTAERLVLAPRQNRAALTQKHLRLLREIDTHNSEIVKYLSEVNNALTDFERSHLSYQYMPEAALRYVALCESGKHPRLCDFFGHLAKDDPLPFEKISSMMVELVGIGTQLMEKLSWLAKDASGTVTAINQGKLPQTAYYKALRQVQSDLLTLIEPVKSIKKEISHVQIPDVL